MKIRPERVAERIHREAADILGNKVRDPALSRWVSVTGVDVNHDLSLAKVFVSILAEGDERRRTLEALDRARPFVRRELGARLGLREVPDIRFQLDVSLERGARVDELLRKIHEGEPVDDEEEGTP